LGTKRRRTTIDQFLRKVSASFEGLSRQLKLVALFLERHREHVGILGVQDLARECGVQPSTIVRFAKHFGLSGFSEMQRIFREGLSLRLRARENQGANSRRSRAGRGHVGARDDWLDEFFADRAIEMRQLGERINAADFNRAELILRRADNVWVMGVKRSFPVAVYVAQSLQHAGQRVMLAPISGGFTDEAPIFRKGDALVAICLKSGDDGLHRHAAAAKKRGTRVIAMVESRMNGLASLADVYLAIGDHDGQPRRSIAPAMALMDALAHALAPSAARATRPGSRRRRAQGK
jgi:DNA-binding MurR/RpiR family transcriptional regulator